MTTLILAFLAAFAIGVIIGVALIAMIIGGSRYD